MWLLLGWLSFHDDVARAHGRIHEVVELGEKLSPAGLGVAASFVAYLIGSLSEDVFGRRFIRGFLPPSMRAKVSYEVKRNQADFIRLSGSFKESQLARIENDADRFKAERELRVAILPPLLALIVFLTIVEGPLWLVGLLLAAGMGYQAFRRERDFQIANESLVWLRGVIGVPPSSVAEAQLAEDQRTSR